LSNKTAEYVRKRNDQETVALDGKVQFFRDLDLEVEKADGARQSARQAVTHHGREHKQLGTEI
jgi:hypothetical protein